VREACEEAQGAEWAVEAARAGLDDGLVDDARADEAPVANARQTADKVNAHDLRETAAAKVVSRGHGPSMPTARATKI
jgi:hypothetical protein